MADELVWLEDVHGAEALSWVRSRSTEAETELRADPRFEPIRSRIQEALEADDRIPLVSAVGAHLYNFWTDTEHERGLWRRTSWDSYLSGDPQWEVLLDLDELAAREQTPWVWHGARILRPDHDRALVALSPGGSDADVTRELDLTTGTFVPTPEGFHRELAKGSLAWIDRDTVFACTDVGPGSMTRSGYPRTVRRWARGTALAAAPEVFAGDPEDMYVGAWHDPTPGHQRDLVRRARAFYDGQTYLLGPDGDTTLLPVPDSAEVEVHRSWLTILLRHDWELTTGGRRTTFPAGALLTADLDGLLSGAPEVTIVFAPDGRSSLADWTWTCHHLVLTVLRDVQHSVEVWTPDALGWSSTTLETAAPDLATVTVAAVDEQTSDDLWVLSTSWLSPMRLGLARLGERPAQTSVQPVRTAPDRFDATGLEITQHWARSADGTRVPYFQVAPQDLPLDGSAPTVLHGYGGFEQALTPAYDPIVGTAWLARGGVYVVAGIRGGGEFGPTWHQAALQEHRHRAYQDFVAVGRDLVRRGVTSVEHLGCTGRSNGGLLVGNMLTSYPEDFGAIVCQVPLLDMRRYSRLLAGSSWMAEYGDPDDPEQWDFIKEFSPYHRFSADQPVPPTFLATSTQDDRVHPGHARKMAELLRRTGKDVTYWENTEGGHGGASTPAQWSVWHALPWTFLHRRLTGS